jgi:hypothetical protein
MTRSQAVVLVSRALSLLWGASGLDLVTYLPERLFSFSHYANGVASVGGSMSNYYLPTLYRIEVALLFVRIAIYLTLAVVFWKCGPWVERTLLPKIAEIGPPTSGTEPEIGQ